MDQHLRELERRAVATPVDRAKYLVELVRIGRLSMERVELAARSGDEAARIVIDRPLDPTRALSAEIAELVAFGREVVVRAAVIAAEVILPTWKGMYPGADHAHYYVRQVMAARSWTDCPCSRCEAEVRDATSFAQPWPFTEAPGLCARLAALAVITPHGIDYAVKLATTCVMCASRFLSGGSETMADAIQRDLVRWAVPV